MKDISLFGSPFQVHMASRHLVGLTANINRSQEVKS